MGGRRPRLFLLASTPESEVIVAHLAYPPFSLACVRDTVRIVRGRTVAAEQKLFAKCVWSLAGTGLGATIGEPEEVEPVFASDAIDDGELAECRAALEVAYEDGMAYGAGEGEAAIDPATLAILIDLAVKLITKWLERRKSGS